MSKKPRRALSFAIYGTSVALHIALAGGAVLAPKIKKSVVVAISLSEAAKTPPKEVPHPPPPPPAHPAKAKAVAAAAPKASPLPAAAEPAPSPASAAPEAFADLGMAMGNGADGMAVPVAARPVAAAAAAPVATARKVRALAPVHEDVCDEPIVKAKLRGALVRPSITDEAKAAQIEGVVRVEITIDEQGNVLEVKVLRGLGYGLDESAVRAAKKMTFEPGTRCGKAVVTKFTVGMRFTLEE